MSRFFLRADCRSKAFVQFFGTCLVQLKEPTEDFCTGRTELFISIIILPTVQKQTVFSAHTLKKEEGRNEQQQ